MHLIHKGALLVNVPSGISQCVAKQYSNCHDIFNSVHLYIKYNCNHVTQRDNIWPLNFLPTIVCSFLLDANCSSAHCNALTEYDTFALLTRPPFILTHLIKDQVIVSSICSFTLSLFDEEQDFLTKVHRVRKYLYCFSQR